MRSFRTWPAIGLAASSVAFLLLAYQLYVGLSVGPIALPEPEVELTPEPGDGLSPGDPDDVAVPPPRGPPFPEHPNVLLILSDDQRADTMAYMPTTSAYLFDQGATFERAYVTTPLCCPSRASLLTGLYASNHGVWLNPYPLEHRTFFEDLQEQGYRTGLVGKYLNSHDGSPRPGFDTWVSHAWGTSRSFDPDLNVNGAWMREPGHITPILREHVVEFVAADDSRPWALLWSANAMHWSHEPEVVDRDLYLDLAPWRPPSYNEANATDKPTWLQRVPLLTPTEQVRLDELRRQQLQSLASLDRAIGHVLGVLHDRGELDETVVLYTSDHGVFWGEHRLREKNRVYEEVVRVPLAIRYPPLVPVPETRDELVTNLDVTATIYDLTNTTAAWTLDGVSLASLLSEPDVVWRDHFFLEGWLDRRPAFTAVHTGEHVYVRNIGDRPELYDLPADPYQLENRAGQPEVADLEAALAALLDAR